MKLIFTTLLFLISSLSFASGRAGNGGDAVVCGNDVFMLDYVEEYHTDRSFELEGDIRTLVTNLIQGISKLDQTLFQNLKNYSESFLKGIEQYESQGTLLTETVEFTRNYLSDVPDEDFYQIPEGCEVKQLIIMRKTNSIIQTEFLVRKSLWDRMTNFQKAIGVVHESVYKYMRISKQTTSFIARYYNRLIFTKKLESLTHKDYLSLIKEFQILHPVTINGVHFHPYKRNPRPDYTNCLSSLTDGDYCYYWKLGKATYHSNGSLESLPNSYITAGYKIMKKELKKLPLLRIENVSINRLSFNIEGYIISASIRSSINKPILKGFKSNLFTQVNGKRFEYTKQSGYDGSRLHETYSGDTLWRYATNEFVNLKRNTDVFNIIYASLEIENGMLKISGAQVFKKAGKRLLQERRQRHRQWTTIYIDSNGNLVNP